MVPEVFIKRREQHLIPLVHCCADGALCIIWVQANLCRGEVAVCWMIPFPVQFYQL